MPLALSEVLANEPGSVVALEWVELAANTSVDASRYTLSISGTDIVLPTVTLDSGEFLVICRDTVRFEQHYGNSSGTWGDHAGEQYPLRQAGFSLANSSGEVRLAGGGNTDRFAWSSSAPDGVSFERIADSLWQITVSPPGATPGRHNHGAPLAFDWGIDAVRLDPHRPRPGTPYTVHIETRNRGSSESTSMLTVSDESGALLDIFDAAGLPSQQLTFTVALVAHEGLQRVVARLEVDQQNDNNESSAGFFASGAPVYFTEVYGAPAGAEAEWIECFVAADTAVRLAGFTFGDGPAVATLPADSPELPAQSYFILCPDTTLFRLRYGDSAGTLIASADWPTLNNGGDTLVLIWNDILVDRAAYPSFGSRRGVSYERIDDGDVWGLCAASAGATPGHPNSIDVPYSEEIHLSVSPNPFAARLGEEAEIRFTVPFAASGELSLFSGDGRRLRTLYPAGRVVSGSLAWDGRDAGGRPCPVGIYLVQLRLTEPYESARLVSVVVAP
jgi:hypothetical protein